MPKDFVGLIVKIVENLEGTEGIRLHMVEWRAIVW